MKNKILAEVWRNRDASAKRCNYDLHRMVEELRRIAKDRKNPLVHGERKPTDKETKPPRRSEHR